MENPLEACGLFDTPTTMEGLQDWIMRLSGSERAVAQVAAGMAWNLAAYLVDKSIQNTYNNSTVNN